MNMKMKQLVAVALASVMTFGAASVAISPVSYAHDSAQHEYADGTTNKYSHALKEEEARHEQAVRTIRYQYRQDGNEKQYQKDLKKEHKEKHGSRYLCHTVIFQALPGTPGRAYSIADFPLYLYNLA